MTGSFLLLALLRVCLAAYKWNKQQSFDGVEAVAISNEGLNVLLGNGKLKKLVLIKKIIQTWPDLKSDVTWITSVGHQIAFSTWAITRNGQLHWRDMKENWKHLTTTQFPFKHISAGNFGVWAITTTRMLMRKEGEIFDPDSSWIPIEGVKQFQFEHVSTGGAFSIAVLSFSSNRYFKFNKKDEYEIIQVPFYFKWIEVSPNDDTVVALTVGGTLMLQERGKTNWIAFGGLLFYRCFPITRDSILAWTGDGIYNLECQNISAEPHGKEVDVNITEQMRMKLRLPKEPMNMNVPQPNQLILSY